MNSEDKRNFEINVINRFDILSSIISSMKKIINKEHLKCLQIKEQKNKNRLKESIKRYNIKNKPLNFENNKKALKKIYHLLNKVKNTSKVIKNDQQLFVDNELKNKNLLNIIDYLTFAESNTVKIKNSVSNITNNRNNTFVNNSCCRSR